MGANDKVEAMFHSGECTPDIEQLRDLWVDSKLDHLPRPVGIPLVPTVQAEFDRWLDRVRAEAKAEALREAATEIELIDSEWNSAQWLEDKGHYQPIPEWLRSLAEKFRERLLS